VQVSVNLLGPLKDQVGESSLQVELPEGATYRDLLDEIGPLMEAKLADWAWDAKKRSFTRRMMVSRNATADLRDESTCLADGDEIFLVLPLAGG